MLDLEITLLDYQKHYCMIQWATWGHCMTLLYTLVKISQAITGLLVAQQPCNSTVDQNRTKSIFHHMFQRYSGFCNMQMCLVTSSTQHSHRINTQPEVRLRVGTFDVGVLVYFRPPSSSQQVCMENVYVILKMFTKKISSLLTLERGR